MEGCSPPTTQYYPHQEIHNEWSRNERLFIRLYHELVYTASMMSPTPYIFLEVTPAYTRYCGFFADHAVSKDGDPNEAGSGIVKGMDIFQVKRDELVGALLWGIQTNNNSVDLDGPYAINGAAISRPVFEEYWRIRERMGFETYVYNPAMWPELSAFLVNNIRKQHPKLFSSTNQSSERAKDKDATNQVCQHNPEVELNGGVTSAPGTEPSSHEPTTDLHDPMKEGRINALGADNSPTKSDQIRPVDAFTDDTVESMNQNDITQVTGPVQCVGLKHGGLRCGRKDQKVSEAERGPWLCHLHAPGKKKAVRAEFAANTAATANSTGALKPTTVTKKGSREGTKRSREDKSSSEETPDAKRTKRNLGSASDDLQSENDPSQSDPIVFTIQKPLGGGEYFETDPSNTEWNFVNFTTTLNNEHMKIALQ